MKQLIYTHDETVCHSNQHSMLMYTAPNCFADKQSNLRRVYTRLLCLFFGICLLVTTDTYAQKFKYSIPGLDTLEEAFIVSGGSSTVLKSGEGEIILNNNLTSYWIAFHETNENSPIIDRFRRTQFTTDIFAFYGISASGTWDLGINLKYARARLDNSATSSMFRVFQGNDGEDATNLFFDQDAIFDRNFAGLASVGLRFRVKPFKLRPELVISGGYSLTTVKEDLDRTQLGADRDNADIGITYYKALNTNTYYFFGGTAQIFFSSDLRNETLYNTGANFFLIHRTTNTKFTFYPGLAYNISFKSPKLDDASLIKVTDFLLAFGGVQFAPSDRFNVFFTAGFPLIVNVTNPQQEIVRASYSTLSLGTRIGF